jgi:hypothetical protein
MRLVVIQILADTLDAVLALAQQLAIDFTVPVPAKAQLVERRVVCIALGFAVPVLNRQFIDHEISPRN